MLLKFTDKGQHSFKFWFSASQCFQVL